LSLEIGRAPVVYPLVEDFYCVVRKHAGWQSARWQFTFRQLHKKSGSAARFSDFAFDNPAALATFEGVRCSLIAI
jgi:plasmid replication initiation protein